MKTSIFAAVLSLAVFVAASPAAEPNPDPAPFDFYAAHHPSAPPLKKKVRRELVVRADTIIPEQFLVKKSLEKRTQSPTSGPDANKCGPTNQVASASLSCGAGNDGPCCSYVGWCGATSPYCGGGCQEDFGSCVPPTLQLTYDTDTGDAIWDAATDNVFDAQVGDGIIYYGATPSGGWPS